MVSSSELGRERIVALEEALPQPQDMSVRMCCSEFDEKSLPADYLRPGRRGDEYFLKLFSDRIQQFFASPCKCSVKFARHIFANWK